MLLIKLTLPWLTTGIRNRVGRKLPRATEEAEHIRTSRAACVSMGKLEKKKSYRHPTPELSSAVLECSAPPVAFFFFGNIFVWILFNIPTPVNKKKEPPLLSVCWHC